MKFDMKKNILFVIFIVVLFLGCGNPSPSQDLLSKINEITRLRSIERKIIANDSTLLYIAKIQKIIDSDKNLPDTLLIENLFRKGFYYKTINDLDSASYYFHKTIDLIGKPNNRDRNIIYFRNAWETDERRNKVANAVRAAQKFIDITDEKEYPKDIAVAYNCLERINLNLKNAKKAFQYNRLGLNASKEAGDLDMYVITGNSKARQLYDANKKREAFNFLDSLTTVKSGKNPMRQLYRDYGILHFEEDDFNIAIIKYKQSLKLAKELTYNLNYNLIEGYNNIAEAYIVLQEYDEAKQYLDSSKVIINPDSNVGNVEFYNELSFRLNFRTNKNEDEVLDKYYSLIEDNNRLHEENINEELAALKTANEKEKIIIAQKTEAEVNIFRLLTLVGFLLLMFLLGYLLYRQRRYKFEKQNLQMQQRLLRSQMNPHFMFNTLSVIQNQIKDNQEHALNYLLKFSRLLRLILENSLSNYVQIENELESLRKYIELQLLRFPEKFTYAIELENLEEDELLFIPPMLIQPFVENSIEHGFIGIKNKGHINIKLALLDKWIECTIEDDGAGLNHSNDNYKKSVSTKLISQFIYKITKHKIVILDKKSENKMTTGVLVKFYIPYKLSKND